MSTQECIDGCPIVAGLPEEVRRRIIANCALACLNGPIERQTKICGSEDNGAKNEAVQAAIAASRLAISEV